MVVTENKTLTTYLLLLSFLQWILKEKLRSIADEYLVVGVDIREALVLRHA